ncbi:4528_t:CDS:2 [Racocetra fulgida]|uniref:4528_t:CDS:1 n=1 Tax=Racocetra fulgida TaxID=60492 RepID=A0A9N9AID7_9GLOM|nr:4528_t:CDS:2 [Racocetra fulgida]
MITLTYKPIYIISAFETSKEQEISIFTTHKILVIYEIQVSVLQEIQVLATQEITVSAVQEITTSEEQAPAIQKDTLIISLKKSQAIVTSISTQLQKQNNRTSRISNSYT